MWPARSHADRRAIERVARVFDLDARAVRALPGRTDAGDELVLGVGPATRAAARLYAHLTHRRCRVVDDVRALAHASADDPPSVVVALEDDLDARMLETVHDAPAVAGVVAAPDPSALTAAALAKAAAARGPGGADVSHVALFPLFTSGAADEARPWRRVSSLTGPDVDAGTSGLGVVAAATHSDGVDAHLGDATLCGVAAGGAPGAARAPTCIVAGRCHRLDAPLDRALSSPSLVSPATLSARVLLWMTCLGVVPTTWPVDRRGTVGTHLLANASIGALLTAWTIGRVDERMTTALTDALAAGASAGAALGAYRSSVDGGYPHARLALFGDPRTRATPAPAQAPDVRLPAGRRVDARAEGAPDPFGVDVARASLRAGAVAGLEPQRRALVDALGARGGAGLCEAAVAYVAARGWSSWTADWSAGAASVHAAHGVACRSCGQPAEVYVGVLASGARRRTTVCPSCNTVEDGPVRWRAPVVEVVPGNALALRWRPDGAWAARLRLSSADPAARASWPWPRAGGGLPRAVFRPPGPWPVGPVRITAVVASRAGLGVVTRILHAA